MDTIMDTIMDIITTITVTRNTATKCKLIIFLNLFVEVTMGLTLTCHWKTIKIAPWHAIWDMDLVVVV